MNTGIVTKKITARRTITALTAAFFLLAAKNSAPREVQERLENPMTVTAEGFSPAEEGAFRRIILDEFESRAFSSLIAAKRRSWSIRVTLHGYDETIGEQAVAEEGPGRYIMKSHFRSMIRLTLSLDQRGTTVTMNQSGSRERLKETARNLAERLRPLLPPEKIGRAKPDSLPGTDAVLLAQISRKPALDLSVSACMLVPVGNFFEFSNALAGYSVSMRLRGFPPPGIFLRLALDHGFMLGERYYIGSYHVIIARLGVGYSWKAARRISFGGAVYAGTALHFLGEKSGRSSFAGDFTFAVAAELEVYFTHQVIGSVSIGGGFLAEKTSLYGYLTVHGGVSRRFTW